MAEYRITYIRKSKSDGGYEHITHGGNTSPKWELSVGDIIWNIEVQGNKFFVLDDRTGKSAIVAVVRSEGRAPYLRTHADGFWNDNLLSLPVYSTESNRSY